MNHCRWSAILNVGTLIVCIQYHHGDAISVMYQNVTGGISHFSTVSHHYYLDWQVKSPVHLHFGFLAWTPTTTKWVICSRQEPRTVFSHNLQGLWCVAGPDKTLSRCQPGTQYYLCAAAMLPALKECCYVLLTDNFGGFFTDSRWLVLS